METSRRIGWIEAQAQEHPKKKGRRFAAPFVGVSGFAV